MENNNNGSSGANTVLLVIVIIILVAGGLWYYYRGRGNSGSDNSLDVQVNLPGGSDSSGGSGTQ
jgi:hypothetical protein